MVFYNVFGPMYCRHRSLISRMYVVATSQHHSSESSKDSGGIQRQYRKPFWDILGSFTSSQILPIYKNHCCHVIVITSYCIYRCDMNGDLLGWSFLNTTGAVSLHLYTLCFGSSAFYSQFFSAQFSASRQQPLTLQEHMPI